MGKKEKFSEDRGKKPVVANVDTGREDPQGHVQKYIDY